MIVIHLPLKGYNSHKLEVTNETDLSVNTSGTELPRPLDLGPYIVFVKSTNGNVVLLHPISVDKLLGNDSGFVTAGSAGRMKLKKHFPHCRQPTLLSHLVLPLFIILKLISLTTLPAQGNHKDL